MHDVAVLLSIKEFFGDTGHLYPKLDDYRNLDVVLEANRSAASYNNSKTSVFTPFFDTYCLLTRKQLDYLDFKKFLALKEAKAYKTEEGLKEMEKIVSNMNRGRDGRSRRKPL